MSRPLVVTRNSIASHFRKVESVSVAAVAKAKPTAAALATPEDPVLAAQKLKFLGKVQDRIDRAQKAAETEDVLVVPHSDREAALLLSMLAEGEHGRTTATDKELPQGKEAKFDTHDVPGWVTVAWEKLTHWKPLPLLRPPAQSEPLPNKGRISITGDWGTGLYGAPLCAESIEKDTAEHAAVLHLGDVYYSGTPNETRDRFLALWPKRRDRGLLSRGCNGNHEMYSGGHGYFNATLPAFQQGASYFALENDHWILAGLDLAHDDHAIDQEQVDWLKAVMNKATKKRVVLFSHHQPWSRLEKQGWKVLDGLGDVMSSGRVAAWYWGHEHQCCLYDQDPKTGIRGRCVGHSGMPEGRKKVTPFPAHDVLDFTDGDGFKDQATWRKFDSLQATQDGSSIQVPAGLILDGHNRDIRGEEHKFIPHGYLTLDLAGDTIVERICTARGHELYRGSIK